METKIYGFLPKEAISIRESVFVIEQGFIVEFDDIDSISKHLLIFENNMAIATCRFYIDNTRDSYILGRIAVIKEFRKRNIGKLILDEVEKEINKLGGTKISLSAQVRASGFYEKNGYIKKGEQFLDEYCPHIWMEKIISCS